MNDYERIEKVIKYLDENFKDQPSLKTLAKVAHLSESHFQRMFTRWTGVTPKTFLKFLTAQNAKKLLLESKDLLSASLDSGLSGPGRLHDLMISVEAMTPGEVKSKGLGIEIKYGTHETPFGECLIGVTSRGVCHLVFIDSSKKEAISHMKEKWAQATFISSPKDTEEVIKKIFEKKKGKLSILLQGTSFQMKVWEALLSVPEGSLISYDRLASLAGFQKAARAVGTAVGSNSIAYLIPCHRVIRETGVIGQYRWGTTRKRCILTWEQSHMENQDE